MARTSPAVQGHRSTPRRTRTRRPWIPPTCGIRYQHTTKGGTFTVTATTSWVVQWTGGGQSGQIQMPTTTSTTDVRVGELQSVNVTTTGDTYN